MNFTLKKKIIIFAITLLSLLVVSSTTGVWGLYQVRIAKNKAAIAVQLYENLQELRILFEQTLMGPHDYLIHGNKDEKKIFLEDYKKLIVKSDGLRSLILSQKLRHDLKLDEVLSKAENQLLTIEEKLPEFKIKALDIFGLKLPTESHKAGFYMEEMDFFIRELGADLKTEAKVLLELSDRAKKRIDTIHIRVLSMLIIFGSSAVFIGMLASYYLIRSITGPIANLIKVTRKIKGGDLTVRAKVGTHDEIGELADSFNEMVGELVDTQERVSSILHGSGDAMCVIDEDCNIFQINREMEKMTGMSATKIVGTKCYEIFPDERCHTNDCPLKRVLGGEEWTQVETTKKTKDGKKIPVELVATPLKKRGKTVGVIESFRDVRARKMAEKALRESEEKLTGIVDSVTDLMTMMDERLTIVWANDVAKRVYGEKLVGKRCYTAYCRRDTACESCSVKECFKDGKAHEFETEIVGPDGDQINVWCTANVAERHEDGSPKMVVEFIRDITEHRKLEAQLLHAQKMESIGTLAGGVAHDFNNLLTVILGNAQLALMDVIKDESLRKEIKEIKKAGEKAASLTRQLLAFSRKQIVQPKILDINEVINEMEKMLKYMIGENIDFQTVLGPELWKDCADPGQINQIIMNMVINSRDAMLRGGGLTIETANTDLNENYFCEHGIKEVPGHYVMLAVSDTGSGMDKEIQEHIFEPFFTTKEVGQGTGLGLSTIYGIVKQNNGFVWVYSEPGKGTTFKVYLPKVKDAEPEEKEQTPVDDSGGSETVLIVEDDDNLRKFAQRALQMYGYRILDAENGEDALRVCGEYEGQIDLMITDVVMPKMGGREAAERLQHLYPQIKVIYMSGYTDNTIVHYGVLTPELNFIQKPFTPKGLARKVREALESNHYKLRQRNV